MMDKTNIEWAAMTDHAILETIGNFIRHMRLEQNRTQLQVAKDAGINRWTLGQIEKGTSITLGSLIRILRVLDVLHLFNAFKIEPKISPIEYAKLMEKKRQRASSDRSSNRTKKDPEW
jgi:transcriptional regulator with XRE-family HTH domain